MTSGAQNNGRFSGATRGRPFPKGVSGNPGGKPKVAGEVRALLEGNTLKAAEKLIAMLNDSDTKIALAAANGILDRVLGKPRQAVEVESRPSVNAVLAAFLTRRDAESEPGDEEERS
jgi:hypothetical protein